MQYDFFLRAMMIVIIFDICFRSQLSELLLIGCCKEEQELPLVWVLAMFEQCYQDKDMVIRKLIATF